jgi:hypothetical protein
MGDSQPWPSELGDLFARSVTAEFSSFNRSGTPVTIPTIPYVGENGTIDISTGVTYPTKAERARRNPQVSLLFADPVGDGMEHAPVALIQGHAAVRDADLQANTDRYVLRSAQKVPEATKGQPKFVLKRMAFYYARVWIEITPLRIRWWPNRELAQSPEEWRAAPNLELPTSDPGPVGKALPAWRDPPGDWRPIAARSLARLPLADLTVGEDGFPLCVPVSTSALDGELIPLRIGPGAPEVDPGPACLTLHDHATKFTGQENHTLMGNLEHRGEEPVFRVERALADWSLAGGKSGVMMSFLSARRVLAPRLAAEAAKRGQAVPKVRFG